MKFSRIFPFILCVLLSACSTQNAEQTEDAAAEEQIVKSEKHPDARETTLGPVHVVVSLSDSKPTLGEQIELSLTVDAKMGVTITMPDFGDQLGKFSIADYQSSEKQREDGRMEYVQKYTLDLPMSGKLRTPSFLVEFVDNQDDSEQKGKIQEVLTEEMTLEVASVFAEGEVPESLYPAEGVLPELVLPKDKDNLVWLWVLLGLMLCGAVGAFVYYEKHKQVNVYIPPDIVALRALDDMKARDIPVKSEEVDAWYVELSSIVRTYIEGRFSLHAPCLTTEEVLEIAKNSEDINVENKILIKKLLEHSDRVKFTDFVPPQSESAAMLEDARKFVVDTREVPEGDNHV
ncbi:MAG: hypothetical protein J6A01_07330 [Proteobacteria bacterium]|nr:hypothetical protein [Pseudomonadota bacterium]